MSQYVNGVLVAKPAWYTYTFTDVDAADIDDAPNAITIGSRGFIWTEISWDDGSNNDLNLRIWDQGRGGSSFMTARIPVIAVDDNLPLPLPGGVVYPFKPNSTIRMECNNDGASANAVLEIILGGYEPTAAHLALMLSAYGEG